MDKASDYETGDSRFESWQGRDILSISKIDFILNISWHYCLPPIRDLVAQWIRHLITNQGIPCSSYWQGRNILSISKIGFILNIYWHYCLHRIRGVVAQWIRHLTTNQGIPGSSHGIVVTFCQILR